MTDMEKITAKYDVVIGLEVHIQLKTKAKMFSPAPYKFGAEPNTLIDPIVMGLPGVLPKINEEAVNFAIKLALALGSEIHEVSRFARKHYFYPDLPKGYQITQYEYPYCEGGAIPVEYEDGSVSMVPLVRIHMEEDTGKSMHMEEGVNFSLVDYNRAGAPLLEIVSQPAIHSPQEAVAYLKSLRQVVRHLGICDANMEEGSLRCDANISLKPVGSEILGIRTEIKNLNSFKAVEQALTYEIHRHYDVLEAGDSIVQATMLWDPAAGRTRVMRTKEEAEDYRYFPEPDLPPLVIEPERIERIRRTIPELPHEAKARLIKEYGITRYDAEILVSDALVPFFEEVAGRLDPAPAKKAANWIITEVLRELKNENGSAEDPPVSAEDLALLIDLVEEGKLTGINAKKVFDELAKGSTGAEKTAERLGVLGTVAMADDELEAMCRNIVQESPAQVAKWKKGNHKVMGYFVGQVMRQTKGKAQAQKITALFQRILDE